MKTLRNERGIALVMVMVLSLIGLAIVSALLFMLTQGTRISGVNRAFRTANEAGLGGVNIAAQFIGQNVSFAIQKHALVSPVGTANLTTHSLCLAEKLTGNTTTWTDCITSPSSSNELSFDPTVAPDLWMVLNGVTAAQNFTVNAKIVDTVPGSSDTTGLVRVGTQSLRGVADQSNEYRPPANPYLYRVEVQAHDNSGRGVGRYSMLYAY